MRVSFFELQLDIQYKMDAYLCLVVEKVSAFGCATAGNSAY